MIKYKLLITCVTIQLIISIQCKRSLHLTNDMIENRLLSEMNKIVQDASFYESLNAPHDGIKGEWNDTIVSNDISRHTLREIILDSLDETTHTLNKLDSPVLSDASGASVTQRHFPSVGDLSTLFTSSFVCGKSERQFSFLQDNSARVCCNSRSGTTRSCRQHRCKNTPSPGNDTSSNCCETKKSLRFCPGSFSESFHLGQNDLKECINRNVFIDIATASGRVCCVSSSMCTQRMGCAKIVQRTSIRDSSNRFLCCQPYSSMSYYCSAASESAVVVSPPGGGGTGPVNPGYYNGQPPPPPPVVNPTSPGIYPPPTGGQPPPSGPFRPMPGRPCPYARTDIGSLYSHVTDTFVNVSQTLDSLRRRVLFTSLTVPMERKFSNISNQLVSTIALFKEKQAYIRRSNRKLGIKVN